jgi:branched-chain amino acid transport system permease protein
MLQILLNKKVGPELLGISNTVNPLLMTIIGGIGTFTGPVIGASGLHLLDTVLRESVITLGSASVRIADVWELILGGIFILTVIIFPQGIVGTWQRWRTKRTPLVEKNATSSLSA